MRRFITNTFQKLAKKTSFFFNPGGFTNSKAPSLIGRGRRPLFINMVMVMFFMAALTLHAIEVSPSGTHYVGDTLTFRPTSTAFGNAYRADWDFGDGTTFSTTSGMSSVTHAYSSAGTYTVRVVGQYSTAPITETVSVRIDQRAPRAITFTPAQPLVGAPVQFTAVNFLSAQIQWNFGDGVAQTGGVSVPHTYNNAGTYTVTAREVGSNYSPISVVVTVIQPARRINVSPRSPRVDQPVYFQAQNFITNSIDWNFGDGTIITAGGTSVTHRFQAPGTYTISAKDSTINHTPATFTLGIAAENRYIMVSPTTARTNETVTVTAYNFRGDYLRWDFGDGTGRSGLHTETHRYLRPGTYVITAQDENGESQKRFTTQVKIEGIDDQVNLQLAEITLGNGKPYQVISKNSRHLQALLRMKMRGTGIVSGYWVVDGHPFEFFTEVAHQGEVKEIYTRRIPGLPTIDPGIHTVTLTLTRPGDLSVAFPLLRYFVLPYENLVEILTPPDGFIAKEKEIPVFSWKESRDASRYQIVFSNDLFPMMEDGKAAEWIDVGTALAYTPGPETWDSIKRNRWTYWKVRALDTANNVVAESDIIDIKVVIATAEISLDKVTDLEGKEIAFAANGNIDTRIDDILVHGSIEYLGDAEFLVLRVYVEDELTDQLLFRDVKKNEKRYFETALPNREKKSQVWFKVLRVSSPAVIVGIKGLVVGRS